MLCSNTEKIRSEERRKRMRERGKTKKERSLVCNGNFLPESFL
jgi:hypothetical protein